MSKKKEQVTRETWTGYRPSIMRPKKNDKYLERKKNKQICKDAMKGEN